MFKHILIPTDGSPIAARAVKAGIRFARELGARVTVYQAIGTLLTHIDDEGYVIDPKIHDEFERTARQAAQRRFDAIGRMARTAGVSFNSVVTMVDAPHKGIIDAARKHKCDVIFMASHGRRGVASLLLGSVTQKVLTHCKIPVLVYR